MSLDTGEFAAVYRREVGRSTATLVRVLGDIDLAEDAVGEAFAIAAERWPVDGLPPNPGGWITRTARNRAIDRLRREAKRDARELESVTLHDPSTGLEPDLGSIEEMPDDQLRLMFLCCHPELGIDAQVALTLRLLGGLTTAEIARAFLVSTSTMGQRLSRAKRKLRHSGARPFTPPPVDLPARLDAVLATVYLVYTEGHTATSGKELRRFDLAREAIRLGRILAERLPDQPESVGLLALMLLTEARSRARIDSGGRLVRLADQDRSLWDRELVVEGHALVRQCIAHNQPGRYQLQAAIAAVHADSSRAEETDWSQIVDLYDHLYEALPTAMVALNRAIAVMERDGPEAGLGALDRVDLEAFHLFHATRAEALRRCGRIDEAREALSQAIALTENEAERDHLERELGGLH